MALDLHRNSRHLIATLTIPSGQDASQLVTADTYSGMEALSVVTLETAFDGTITVETMGDPDADETVDANWAAIQSPPGTDVVVAAQKAVALTITPFVAIRIKSSVNETATRTLYLWGQRRHA